MIIVEQGIPGLRGHGTELSDRAGMGYGLGKEAGSFEEEIFFLTNFSL